MHRSAAALSLALVAGAVHGPAPRAQQDGSGASTSQPRRPARPRAPSSRASSCSTAFEYEDAREAFVEAQKAAPGFAMAYWGEAMTYNHPLWAQTAPEAAREALGAARATGASSGWRRRGTTRNATGCAPSRRSTVRARSRPATPPTPPRCGGCTRSIRTTSRSRPSMLWPCSARATRAATSPPICVPRRWSWKTSLARTRSIRARRTT